MRGRLIFVDDVQISVYRSVYDATVGAGFQPARRKNLASMDRFFRLHFTVFTDFTHRGVKSVTGGLQTRPYIGCAINSNLPIFFQYFLQQQGIVGHNAIHAHFDELAHLVGIVDGPVLDSDVAPVGLVHQTFSR